MDDTALTSALEVSDRVTILVQLLPKGQYSLGVRTETEAPAGIVLWVVETHKLLASSRDGP